MNTIINSSANNNQINPIKNPAITRNNTTHPRILIPEAPTMDQQQHQSQQQNQNHHNESGTPSPIRKSGFFVYPESIVN
jgi:hypothetical protein